MQTRTSIASRGLVVAALLLAGSLLAPGGVSADSFNWHSLNGNDWLSPARGQHYGDCHVFATFSILESKYKLTRNDPVYSADFAEWDFVRGMLAAGYWPGINYFSNGIGNAGRFSSGISTAVAGVAGEVDCRYDPLGEWGVGGWPLPAGTENRMYRSSTSGYVLATGAAQQLKEQLKTYGPSFLRLSTGNDLFETVSSMYTTTRTPQNGPTNHWMALVGYQDDPNVPTGGYWILKNSWGPGWANSGYGYIPYGFLESHFNTEAPDTGTSFTGAVYYTGRLATADWKGGAGYWYAGGINWTKTHVNDVAVAPVTYGWENKETQANFGGAGGVVTISSTAIAHGMAINSDGYSFSGGRLTLTNGGIVANYDVTINSELFVGAPQTWDVAVGKTLTLNGPLHTVVSDATISGAGDAVINGAIDGGGILNTYGHRPGAILKNNSGTLQLNGVSNFGGDVAINAGTLYITPAGGADVAFSGNWSGSGATVINSTGATSIGGGGGSSYSGTITLQGGGTLRFVPGAGLKQTFSGAISGASPVVQDGEGTTVLSGGNSYLGSTTIRKGALQANSGTGLPTSSHLTLDGGVLQSNGSSFSATFSRSLGDSGTDTFRFTDSGGGFAAYRSSSSHVFYIRINNGIGTLNWGTDGARELVGTLKFGSNTANREVRWQNGINLNGASRTIEVVDNPNSSGDFARIDAVITGNASSNLIKTGDGRLHLTSVNTYGGPTTISGGALRADSGTGLPTDSLLRLDGGVLQSNSTNPLIFTRSLGSGPDQFLWTEAGGGFSSGGDNLTVNVGNGASLVWGDQVGAHIVGPLKLGYRGASYTTTFQNNIDLGYGRRTVDVASTSVLSGAISGSGGLIKTGDGRLTIEGSAGNSFTGATTIQGGVLELNKASGFAIAGDLVFDSGTETYVRLTRANQLSPGAVVSWIGRQCHSWQFLELRGNSHTVAGLSDNTYHGVVENSESATGFGNVTLTVNNSTDFSYNGYLRDHWNGSGVLSFVKAGNGTQTLDGANITYTGTTTVSGGKLVLKDIADSGFLARNITNNATLEFNAANIDLDYSGAISGNGSLIKSGGASLTLSGASANTYAGLTTVTDGVLRLNKTSAVALGGNLAFSGGSSSYVYLDRPGQMKTTASVSFNNTSGYGHLVLYGNNATVAGISNSTGRGVIENTQDESGISANVVLGLDSSSDYSFNGYLRDRSGGASTGKLALVKNGAGTQTLVGSNIRYSGGTTVSGGKLVLRDTIHSSFRGSHIVNNATLEFDTATTNVDFTGTISGSGSLRKVGPNKLTLGSAANSYTGPTTVYDGVLAASSTAVPGAVAIHSGAAFAPGNVKLIGSVVTGAATWYGGGEYLCEINDANGTAGANWDLWTVAGDLSIAPTFTIAVSTLSGSSTGTMADFDNETSYSWLLAQATGTIDSFGYLDLDVSGFRNALAPAGYLRLSQNGDSRRIYLNYSLSVAGDANRDNYVDGTDAAVLADHWGQSGGWTDGDFNGDGLINAPDASLLAANWGPHAASSESYPVPEPAILTLVAAGLLSLCGRTRRRESPQGNRIRTCNLRLRRRNTISPKVKGA